MGEHSMVIMSTGKGVWADCECGWEGPTCDSAAQASLVWAEHLRSEEDSK